MAEAVVLEGGPVEAGGSCDTSLLVISGKLKPGKEVNKMPAGDGTGPMGMGSMTGRGMGYCTGYDAPGWSNAGPGRYYGRGYYGRGGGGWGGYGRGGGGWGWRNWSYATRQPGWGYPPAAYGGVYGSPYAPPTPEQEVEMLKGEAEWLKEQLDAISQRMDDLSQE